MNREKNVYLKSGILYLLLIALTYLFVELSEEIIKKSTLPIDSAILKYINSYSSPTLDKVMLFITNLGGVYGVIIITSVILIALAIKRYKYDALFSALSIIGTLILNTILKYSFKRARPNLWELLITEKSYSFPSGHTMMSMAIALTIILLFKESKHRVLITIASLTYAILVAFSRLYLGVHYPTDVIGGWIISLVWVLLSYRLVYKEIYVKREKRK